VRPHAGSQRAFIHDAAFFMRPSYISKWFDDNTHLHTVIATIVAPFEITLRAPSTQPALYDLEYLEEDSFDYILEGHSGDRYTQSISGTLWWLNTRSFVTEGGKKVFFETVANYGAHHLLIMTTLANTTSPRTAWNIPSQCLIPTLRNAPVAPRLIPAKVLRSTAAWARSVKKICPEACMTKLRQNQNLMTGCQLDETALNDLCVFLCDYREFPLLVEGEVDGPLTWWQEVWRYLRACISWYRYGAIRRAKLRAATRAAFEPVSPTVQRTDKGVLGTDEVELEGAGEPSRTFWQQFLAFLSNLPLVGKIVALIRGKKIVDELAGRATRARPAKSVRFFDPEVDCRVQPAPTGASTGCEAPPVRLVPVSLFRRHHRAAQAEMQLYGRMHTIAERQHMAAVMELSGAGVLETGGAIITLLWLLAQFPAVYRYVKRWFTSRGEAAEVQSVPPVSGASIDTKATLVATSREVSPKDTLLSPPTAEPVAPAVARCVSEAAPPRSQRPMSNAFASSSLVTLDKCPRVYTPAFDETKKTQLSEAALNPMPPVCPPSPALSTTSKASFATARSVCSYEPVLKLPKFKAAPLVNGPLPRTNTPSSADPVTGAPSQCMRPGYPARLVPTIRLSEHADGALVLADRAVPEFRTCEQKQPSTGRLCLLVALSKALDIPVEELWHVVGHFLTRRDRETLILHPGKFTLSTYHLALLAYEYSLTVELFFPNQKWRFPLGADRYYGIKGGKRVELNYAKDKDHPDGHFWYRDVARAINSVPRDPARFAPLVRKSRPRTEQPSIITALEENLVFDTWKIDLDRAKKFARDLSAGYLGTMQWSTILTPAQRKELAAIAESEKLFNRERTVQIALVQGAAGSAKSSGLIDLLKGACQPGLTKISAPRAFLRNQIADKLDLQELGWLCQTHEKSLAHGASRVTWFDEGFLYPQGMIELQLLLDSGCTHIVVTGDAAQNEAFTRDVNSASRTLPNYQTVWRNLKQQPYRLVTYRCCNELAARLGIPSGVDRPGRVTHSRVPVPDLPIVHPVSDAVHVASGRGPSATYGTSQGIDWDTPYNVCVTKETISMCSDQSIYVAFTRSKTGVNVVHQYLWNAENLLEIRNRPLLAALMGMGPPIDFPAHFKNFVGLDYETPEGAILHTPKPFYRGGKAAEFFNNPANKFTRELHGAGTRFPERLYDVAPNLATRVSGLENDSVILEAATGEPMEGFEAPICAPTVINANDFYQAFAEDLRPREERELFSGGAMSQQFPDIPRPCDDESLIALRGMFPRHSALDDVTFQESLKKRIAPSSAAKKNKRYAGSAFIGTALFESWCHLFGVDPHEPLPFDAALYEACIIENEEVKEAKGLAVLANNDERASPDWLPTEIHLFLKSQIKAKAECYGIDAKAGQIITCLADEVVLKLGPLCRYADYKLRQLRNPRLWFHNRATPRDLSHFARSEGWGRKGEMCTESDFTLFDQSQDETVLFFEQLFFAWLSVPEELIEFYIDLALHSRTFLGELPVMRFSGQPFTLGGNSNFTAAYMNLRFNLREHLDGGGLAAYCGDDFAADGIMRERATWLTYSSHFQIIAKLVYKPVAGFCSFVITSQGIYKEPKLMNLKLQLARAERRLDTVLMSYYLEHSLLQTGLDEFLPFLSEDDLEAHQENCRFFTKGRHSIGFFSMMSYAFRSGPLAEWYRFSDRATFATLLRAYVRNNLAFINAQAVRCKTTQAQLKEALEPLRGFLPLYYVRS
jgi:hypothetical protein